MVETLKSRQVWLLLSIIILLFLSGCEEQAQFHAWIEPASGHVPYEAEIVCSSLYGQYQYQLPDGEVVNTTSNRIDVTVDRLDWQATVTWHSAEQTEVRAVSAHGSNAPPRILRPRIAADPYRWHLMPRERTLIDFTHYAAGLSGPESGVAYDGDWRVVGIQVECELKELCGYNIADSIFCPPYIKGEYHALWQGHIIDNACIVYPLYTSETTYDGIPYAPREESGYKYDPYHVHDIFELMVQQNAILDIESFPSQDAVIKVVIEDEWGRLTRASFDIPVRSLSYETVYVPWNTRTRFYMADKHSTIYYAVTSKASSPYDLETCYRACAIYPDNWVFFCRESDAIESGRTRCPLCPLQ
jgi:hypothetical protein